MNATEETWSDAFFKVIELFLKGIFLWPRALFKNKSQGLLDNVVTASIVSALINLLIVGIPVALFAPGSRMWLGLLLVAVALIMVVTGYSDHPSDDPPTVGMLTKSDRPWLIDGKTVPLRGIVFLMNWPFIWISSRKIDATWEVLDFEMTILTADKIPTPGHIYVTAELDPYGLNYFVLNGPDHVKRWENIKEELYGVVEQDGRRLLSECKSEMIMCNAADLNEGLLRSLVESMNPATPTDGALTVKPLGIKLRRVQVDFPWPKDIQNSYREKKARQTEYDADLEAAVKFRKAANDPNLTLGQALEKVNRLRLIRDQQVSAWDINSSGNVGTILFPNANINMGGKSGGGGGDNKKDKKGK